MDIAELKTVSLKDLPKTEPAPWDYNNFCVGVSDTVSDITWVSELYRLQLLKTHQFIGRYKNKELSFLFLFLPCDLYMGYMGIKLSADSVSPNTFWWY